MSHRPLIRIAGCLATLLVASVGTARPLQRPSTSNNRDSTTHRQVLQQYCVTCHNTRAKAGGLTLEGTGDADVTANARIWEKVARKLRAGMMPPAGQPRPAPAVTDALASWVEAALDGAAATNLDPGRTEAMHRLNRAEYRNATRDLLGLDLDVSSLLPADDASYGFDYIAGILRFSPTLMEKYLLAAGRLSRAAVGLPPASPNFDVFRLADDLTQDEHIPGLPFGTRGGTQLQYTFPADGEYLLRVRLARQTAGQDQDIPRYDQTQDLEVALDGDPLRVFTLKPVKPMPVRTPTTRGISGGAQTQASPEPPARRPPSDDVPSFGLGDTRNLLDADWQVRFTAKAGLRTVTVAWLNRTPALLETRVEPYLNPFPTGSNTWTPRKGAYVRSVEISGPFGPVGSAAPARSPSRARIFVCHPAREADESACARRILGPLARRAFRRPVTDADIDRLMDTYTEGRTGSSFDGGIAFAVQRLLVSPEFLFRVETEPDAAPRNGIYRVSDLELASRLSFFLWSSIPDDELLDLAASGRLHSPATLERQVRRMLADSRADALVDNFAGQWLLLRNVPALRPDPYKDPDFDEGLRQALRRETELFFGSIVREDRSVLDLLTAKYTFVNARLAQHYGIPNVQGMHFRRVTIPADNPRAGLLGHGSILAVTSEPNRTSPVKRGKWILENLLGVPPPDPPPNVPPLQEGSPDRNATTMRERMAEHRRNPVCASCHSMMDPLGLALENFDQAGRWRTVDAAFDGRRAAFAPIDASGAFPDGTSFLGANGLRQVLAARSDVFVTTLTEKLLTYALGRGVEHQDGPAVRAITRAAAARSYRMSAIVLGIVNSVPFQMRTASAP